MTILFLHGWQSTPGGIKPTYLKDHGHTVLNPALPDDDFDEAVRIAQAEYNQHHPDVVVGSSRGGAVAMDLKLDVPLVLLCPAWKRWGTATTVKPNTVILHSKADEVVPFSDSEELVSNSGLPSESLIEVGTEHRLADEESLKKMLEAVEKTTHKATVEEKKVGRKGCSLSWAAIFISGIVLIDVTGVLIATWLPALQARFGHSGIQVTINNNDGQPLRSVVVHVTEASYKLGDIAPGASAQTVVHASGESHLEVEFKDVDGRIRRLDAGGYFEPGYRGTIQITIKDGAIEENRQQITP
jgi:hypothetical protein